MSLIKSLVLIAFGVFLAFSFEQFQSQKTASDAKTQTVYDRVIQSKTIHCGWVNYPPATYKDLNTGQMRGIFVDAMENVGRQLDLKIDWSFETTWASFYEDMRVGKFDVACTAAWMLSPGELLSGEFTTPLYYSQIGAWVRKGDTRFDNNLAAANSPDVTITGVDGSYAQQLALKKFPNAKNLSAPANAEYVTGLMNVAYGKADITFIENWLASNYLDKNPDSVRQVPVSKQLDIRPNVMVVNKGELELVALLNYALLNVQLTGAMDDILDKYENHPGVFKRVRY